MRKQTNGYLNTTKQLCTLIFELSLLILIFNFFPLNQNDLQVVKSSTPRVDPDYAFRDTCPVPKTSYRQIYRLKPILNISKVPGDEGFNYIPYENSFKVLQGKVILVSGDSTIRNLFKYFCKFLQGNPGRTGFTVPSGWKETKIVQICKKKSLFEKGIYLIYVPMFFRQDYNFWFKNILNKVDESVNKFAVKQPQEVHLFHQIYSLHTKLPCYTQDLPSCHTAGFLSRDIYNLIFSESQNVTTQHEMSCAILANFIDRSQNQLNFEENYFIPRTSVFIHGMTNTPRMAITKRKPYPEQNDMQLELTKTLYHFDNCPPQFNFENFNISWFIDQTTWALGGTHYYDTKIFTYEPTMVNLKGFERLMPQRHACYAGDLHMKTDEGQNMRIQLLLNSF